MNTLWLCLAAVCADPLPLPLAKGETEHSEFDGAVTISRGTPLLQAALRGEAEDEYLVRGQNPTYDEDPNAGAPIDTYTPPPQSFGQPLGQPYQPDPFLGQPGGTYGVFGPQPYRLGWSGRFDAAWIPSQPIKGGPGSFEVTEFNFGVRHSVPVTNSLIFSVSPEAAIRLWQGPSFVGLPGSVYRLGSDFELASATNTPYNFQLGFTPSIATDFSDSLRRESFIFDARGALFYRASPQLMFALGAAFWDRVKDRVVPYAGVVWTPNDRWEFRIMSPKSRISYFLGNFSNRAWWLYGSGEYYIEAYDVTVQPGGVRDHVEIEDWRILLGLRTESNGIAAFFEGGWILDRHVRFADTTPDFGIQNGWLIRAGIRF